MHVIEHLDTIGNASFAQLLNEAMEMPIASKVLMVTPTYFHLDNPINPHMRTSQGGLHTLDADKAHRQWNNLHTIYERIGLQVKVVQGQPNMPDMVFCANQSLPCLNIELKPFALMSNMANDVRHREVPWIAAALEAEGYHTESVTERSPNTLFEGMGDCLWLPGKRFLLGGYGHRTSAAMYAKIADRCQADVAIFELVNPRFYHLDTCLAILDGQTALACKDGFTDKGWALLHAIFPRIISVSLAEADSPGFACNAHCPDGKHVILQSGNKVTEAQLTKLGYVVVPMDTSEFVKSGGSVFCMKVMYF